MKKLSLFILILAITGCEFLGQHDEESRVVCAAVVYKSDIDLYIYSSTPFPENLSFSINDNAIDVEECDPYRGELDSYMEISEDRSEVYLKIFIDEYRADFFEPHIEMPVVDTMDLHIFNGSSCQSNEYSLNETISTKITWARVGTEECFQGVNGRANLDL